MLPRKKTKQASFLTTFVMGELKLVISCRVNYMHTISLMDKVTAKWSLTTIKLFIRIGNQMQYWRKLQIKVKCSVNIWYFFLKIVLIYYYTL